MVLLTDRAYDHGLRQGMVPVFDPQRFGSPSAALTGPALSRHAPASGFTGAAGRRSEGRPTSGRNKTIAYLRAKHPHLAKMVDDGMPVREAFSRVAAERQSRHRGGRSHPDVGATSMPNQDLTRAASSSPDIGGSASRIVDAGWIGAQREWNPADPIGLDPQTILDQQQPGGAFHGPVGVIGQTLFVPMIAAGDVALRGGGALLHGGAAAAGQAVDEFGLGLGSRLERDILTMPEALAGGFGRVPSVFALGKPATQMAINAARTSAQRRMDERHQTRYTGRISRELDKENPSTTGFGKINRGLLTELNKIRLMEGESPIGKRDIRVYANVLRKFQEKRIGLDGMTTEEVAQSIYRVVHGKGTTVERGNFPTAQRLVNENSSPADVAFVGQGPKNDVSVKSVFLVNRAGLQRLRKK